MLTWLLGESAQRQVIAELSSAERVTTSAITAVECARGLARARHDRRITRVEEAAALRLLDEALASWHILDVSEAVTDRARLEFPKEPVRSLDAVHLASASLLLEAGAEVAILSLDERVRANARELEMQVVPK